MKKLIFILAFLPFALGAQELFVTSSVAGAAFNHAGTLRSGGRFNIDAVYHWDWEDEMTGVFIGAGLGYMQFNRASGPVRANSLVAMAGVSAEGCSVFVSGKLSYYWHIRSSAQPLKAFSPAVNVKAYPFDWKKFNILLEIEGGLFDGTGYISPGIGLAWNLDERDKP